MTMAHDPLISFVRYARNDGYAPNYIDRMNLTTKTLVRQAEHYRVPIEILIVEWNPPADKPRLHTVLDGAAGADFATVRIITVPPSVHSKVKGAALKGLHPARALNVGYRRAHGKFVTPFSSDSFLTNAVFEYAATVGFQDQKIYRLDRFDVAPSVLKQATTMAAGEGALIELCAANTVGHHAPQDTEMAKPLGLRHLHTNAAGDFLLMSKTMWHTQRGQIENCDVTCLDTDSLALHAAAAGGGTEIRLDDSCRLYKIIHGNMSHKRVKPVWSVWAKTLSALIRTLTSSTQKRAYLRGLVDIPRRKLEGLPGSYASFERNFYLRARRWASDKKPVKLNSETWGLGGVDLDEISF